MCKTFNRLQGPLFGIALASTSSMKREGGDVTKLGSSGFDHWVERSLGLALLVIALLCGSAYGDVGVVLDESINSSVEWVTGSGHTAVYFSRICPESPVKLRPCRPGEEGSVMNNYLNLGEDQRFQWNVVPLSVYVYGVQDDRERPLFGSKKLKAVLEQKYRAQALAEYCSREDCGEKADWTYMVAAGMMRSMYIFAVKTTLQQDLDLIDKFNSLPNENHFNGIARNCADFAKEVVDTYFPHAAHRDVINDFGMTSPKAVARTFTHYALSHPQLQFYVLHFSQLPGTFRRSTLARDGTEQLYHSKKLLVPMVIFAGYELPVVAAAHVLTGRFNPEREFDEHPAVQVMQASPEFHDATSGAEGTRRESWRAVQTQEREEVVGTPQEWKGYKQEFNFVVREALREEVIPSQRYINHFLDDLDESGKPFVDGRGGLWMKVPEGDGASQVGVGANNILAQGSDPQLAFALLLARVDQVLKSPKHSRETMVEFKQDWALLEYARTRVAEPMASAPRRRGPSPRTIIPAS
jgi:hypothetical protein